jgi:hypothetical protein
MARSLSKAMLAAGSAPVAASPAVLAQHASWTIKMLADAEKDLLEDASDIPGHAGPVAISAVVGIALSLGLRIEERSVLKTRSWAGEAGAVGTVVTIGRRRYSAQLSASALQIIERLREAKTVLDADGQVWTAAEVISDAIETGIRAISFFTTGEDAVYSWSCVAAVRPTSSPASLPRARCA